ncbi:uncharacterized protein LOC127857621 [Dreissena polymorpha]|uniref:uncharacterized protein LOC127857621 n=1 Tax=Dreissena polymorpha TaxID=45954 RepID=UPI002263F4D6|nr:uncharacterized protein LOC127857621 [Dreissena polymorpha]
MTQLFNLSENEIDILAKFLGHDIRVHREFYRLPDGTMQVAKVSKLLMMMESGQITRNSVNLLDDIDVDDECIVENENTEDLETLLPSTSQPKITDKEKGTSNTRRTKQAAKKQRSEDENRSCSQTLRSFFDNW